MQLPYAAFTNNPSVKRTLLPIIMAVALLMSIYQDVHYSPTMPGDMRNRIVGSRLLKDGKSPYFYIWKEGDPVRYYDTYMPPNYYFSASTSTPFFHLLLEPIANLPQYQFSTMWMMLQYMALAATALLALLSMPAAGRKNAAFVLAGIAVLFTYTYGWRKHVNTGQSYLIIPLLAMLCYHTLMQKKSVIHLFIFSVAACSLLLIRPVTALIFIPFLFYFTAYYKWFAGAAVVMAGYILFVLCSPVQKTNWTDYFKTVPMNAALHQGNLPPLPKVAYNPVPIRTFEGIDMDSEENKTLRANFKKGEEDSNFFVLYNHLTGRKISIPAMTICGLTACCIMLLPLLQVRKLHLPFSVVQLFILGFLVYNTFEFFTPITRLAYYWVQFLFPLLLMPVFCRRFYIIPFALLLAGTWLNIVVLPAVKMEHNIGQLLVVIAMYYLVFRELMMQYVNESKLRLRHSIYVA